MRIDALHRHLPLVLTLLVGTFVSACSGAPEAPGVPPPDVDWEVIAAAEQGELQVSWREDV